MKKTVYTLNIGNFAPEITTITYPLIRHYAHKIGADFHIIEERKFPDWPVTYEKLQIHELGKKHGNDWNIYIDSDALVHPETLDWTEYLSKDTVAHNGSDFANIRWRYNDFFRRDGRNIGSCNWFTVASDWCLDLWRPLDISVHEALDNIYPTVNEINTVITTEHLIDDYALSCNIARFGLKFTTFRNILEARNMGGANFFWHLYTIGIDEKINGWKETQPDGKIIHMPGMKEVIKGWGLDKFMEKNGKQYL